MRPDSNSEKLRREITRWGLAALALNGLIGAGIFALPAAAAERAGAFSPVMYVICALLMGTVVLSFGQAASYFRGTGGPILYAGTAFGPLVGFQTGWLLYLGRVTAMAANSNALVSYAAGLWAPLNAPWGRVAGMFAICAFFTAVNVVGVRRGQGTTNTLTVLKLLPLVLFIVLGLFYLQPNAFEDAAVPGYTDFAATLLLLVYAFVGFEGALVPAGESRSPKRDMPRALISTLVLTTVLYVLIQVVCIGVVPDLAATETPLADVARVVAGAPGAWVMTLAALLSIAGNLSAIMLTASRMTYALARDRSLPAWFGKVHESYRTPAASILFLGTLSFLLAATGSFVWLAVASSLTRMLGFGVCIAALPWLKRRFGDTEEALRLPGGFLIPAVALAVCVWLAWQADARAWLLTAGFVTVGSVLYVWSRTHTVRQGVAD